MTERLGKIVYSKWFQAVVLTAIVLNAITLGLETYTGINDEIGGLLNFFDGFFLGVFCVEIGLRVAAYGRRPWDFFREPWNVFDFVVVGAAFIPGLRGDATLLRLVRLLRVVRLVSVLPDMRVLLKGMLSSIAPILSLASLTILVMYVYGMLGWMLFGEELPERFGDIGNSMLTLFVVLTLESWPDVLEETMQVTSWAWVYMVSYVLIASFLIINVVIAIIIGAIEKAREDDLRVRIQESLDAEAAGDTGEADRIETRIDALRQALNDLEGELGHGAGDGDSGRQTARTRMASKGRMKP